ncbi:MAG: FecR domain-containing protein [Alphaproteobacteria bacterium]|nr:FecR domain-containing protein [Alphaproteobacteria bacterium]
MVRIVALTLASALAFIPTLSLADTQIGVNAAIRNAVQEKGAGENALHPARLRGPVHLGDSVVSGDQSALQMLLLDQSVFTVGANARVTIDRFVYDPDRHSSDIAASVAKGAFRFMSGHTLAGFGKNAITTPVATIGVRGTMLEGVVGADALHVAQQQPGLPPFTGNTDGISLVVLRGPGPGSQGFDKPGAIDVTSDGVTVTIDHAGQAVIVWGPGQPPYGPFDLSDAAFAELNLLLRTVPGDGSDQGDFDVTSAGAASGDTNDVGSVGGDTFNQTTGTIDLPGPPARGGGGNGSN